MRVYPNAKINIGLQVGPQREDGYHPIRSLFYPIYGLHDVLDIEPMEGDDIVLINKGMPVDCDVEKNLLVRCYRLMQAEYACVGGVRVTLTKQIPFGAGLGGGSADAAFFAMALNELFELGLTRERLAQMVKAIGADCPFFIYNTPCCVTGIGEILKPIDYSLRGKYIVMLKPAISINTREAYKALDRRTNVEAINGAGELSMVNDFESVVFPLYPILPKMKQALSQAGAYYVSMSGSGSTIYGLFETDAEGRPLADLAALEREFAAMIIFHDTLG